MAAQLLSLQNIALTFGSEPLLTSADLMVHEGERMALVGRNGSGKSTLLKLAAGFIEFDKGERFVKPGATLRYLSQEPDLAGFANTLDYTASGLGPTDDPHQALRLLEQLGLSGQEDPAHLSGGEIRRAALAQVLAPDPDILLFDEPTNHLDLPTIEWLESHLKTTKSALVLISHDRRFLSDLTRSVLWLDRGKTKNLSRGFARFEDWRDDLLEQEEQASHKLERKINAEEHWVRHGVSGRRKRNMRRMRALDQLRIDHKQRRGPQGGVNLGLAEAKTSGKLVAEVENLNKRYDGRQIVKNFSARIMRGDRLGIVGPNGAGKTTLIKMIIGELKPDSGSVDLGSNIVMASLDQHRASLDPMTTLADALTGGDRDVVVINGQERHVMSYMKDFLFTPSQARTPLRNLSGGERARVMLARALSIPSNFMILDEPTNDLDLETLDLLQEMISDYQGTVLLVSHDRDFLDRTVSSIIAPEGDGVWLEYAGGYRDMETQRKASRREGKQASGSANKAKDKAAGQRAKPAAPSKKRLSFHQVHALKTLPKRIEVLAEEIGALGTKLEAADFYQSDPPGFARTSEAFAKKSAEKEELETEWLELELLREEIEAS